MPEKKSKKRNASERMISEPTERADAPKKNRSTPTASNEVASKNDVSGLEWSVLFGSLSILFLWSYWPTLVHLIDQWSRVPDYSHGFLVVPIAIYFLWITREGFVRSQHSVHWAGLGLILVGSLVRFCGTYYYLDAFQGWSIPIWAMGLVWMFFGWPAFLWSFPAIAFLIFMVPLPYSIENMLSVPLQNVSPLRRAPRSPWAPIRLKLRGRVQACEFSLESPLWHTLFQCSSSGPFGPN